MKEIEVKILDINVDEIRKKLFDLGAKKIFSGQIHMISLDFPNERLRKEGKHFRVRKVGKKTEMCIKGKKKLTKFKIREETEVFTSNFEETLKILEMLGFEKFFETIPLKSLIQRIGALAGDLTDQINDVTAEWQPEDMEGLNGDELDIARVKIKRLLLELETFAPYLSIDLQIDVIE